MSRLSSLQPHSIASSAFPSRAGSPAPTVRTAHPQHHHHHPSRRAAPDAKQHRRTGSHRRAGSDDVAGVTGLEDEDGVKTVLVLGGSYSGAHAADVLAKELLPGRTKGRWRVVLIERNSHFHHVYNFPRYAVVPGHAHKAFVPYTRLLSQHDPPSSSASSPPGSTSSAVDGPKSDDEEFADPDRYVEAVSNLKSSLASANADALQRSRSNKRSLPPPKHLVIQASVESIGKGYVDLDRLVPLPSVLTSPSSIAPVPTSALATSPARSHPVQVLDGSSTEGEKEYGCGESGCCDGGRDCYERDSGYAGSLIEEKLAGLAVEGGSSRRRDWSPGSPEGARKADDGTKVTKRVHWDYLIYALGSHPPPPLQLPLHDSTGSLWQRNKQNGVDFLAAQGKDIEQAKRIVVIGGGALGIQYATDIASLYPGAKDITLIHSRHSFLPLYDPLISQSVISTLDDLGVHRVMGERVDMAWLREQVEGWKARKENGAQGGTITVKTLAGREIEADYILLCTGQVPNASLMATFCPLAVPGGSHGGGAIKVLRSMQVAPSRYGPSPVTVSNASAPSSVEIPKARRMARSDTQETAVPIAAKKKREEVEACDCATSPPLGGHKRLWDFEESSDSRLPASDSDVEGEGEEDEEAKEISDPVWKRVFAVGDCADAFGAIKAGHTGWNQAEVAAKNVLRLIKWEEAGGKVDKVDIAETLAEGEEQEGKLLRYEHRAPMMKLTLGLGRSISQLVSMDDPNKVEVTHHRTDAAPEKCADNWQHQWRSLGHTREECDGWD